MRALFVLFAALPLAAQQAPRPVDAARSVHLVYEAPLVTALHVAMTIEQSTAGSYFMAAGWDTGYFGLQELGKGRKVAIFSVWDPSTGDDPKQVKLEDRVECLQQAAGARIERFGGEGTGGKCMIDCDWQLGQPQRLLVVAEVQEQKTAYSGYLWQPRTKTWQQLVTFRVRTGGKAMTGLYSFVEDFRRDTRSVMDLRRARYGDVWVRTAAGPWQAVQKARFTASGSPTEDKDRIGAGMVDGAFFLATGGAAKGEAKLREWIELPPRTEAKAPADLPAAAGK